MPVVDIQLRHKRHAVSCGEGQEEHVKELAKTLDDRLAHLSSALGNTTDYTLLVMAALMMEDELATLQENANSNEHKQSQTRTESTDSHRIKDQQLAKSLETTAERIENLAKLIENE